MPTPTNFRAVSPTRTTTYISYCTPRYQHQQRHAGTMTINVAVIPVARPIAFSCGAVHAARCGAGFVCVGCLSLRCIARVYAPLPSRHAVGHVYAAAGMSRPRSGFATFVITSSVSGAAASSAGTDSPTGLGSLGSCVWGDSCGALRLFVAMVGSSSLASIMLFEPS